MSKNKKNCKHYHDFDTCKGMCTIDLVSMPTWDDPGGEGTAFPCDGVCENYDDGNMSKFTGLYDQNKQPIYVGDKLLSEWGYEVIVTESDNGDYFGKLVCDPGHSCKDMEYCINNGNGHIKQNV